MSSATLPGNMISIQFTGRTLPKLNKITIRTI